MKRFRLRPQLRRLIVPWLVALFAAPALLPTHLRAQAILGTVVRADSTTPAGGIVLLLLRAANDSVVARTVTGERGTFAIRMTMAGSYRIRVLRLGHQPMTLGPIVLGAGEVRTLPVRLVDSPIRLAQIEVRAATQCRVRPDTGLLVAQLYEEARKAMLASVSSTDGVESTAEYEMYSRLVDRRGRLVAPMQVTSRERPTTRPFASLTADSLARVGYVIEEQDGTVYRAPDAEVLLSDTFLSQHCLQVARGTGDRASSIGVVFRPVSRREGVVDIRGTLWMDRASSTLQAIEYTYDPLPNEFAQAGVGGTVEFTKTAVGFWFVNRWNIRMPRTAFRRAAGPQSTGASPTLVVEGLQVTGGEVRSLRLDGILRYASVGVTRDSVDVLAACRTGDSAATTGVAQGRVVDDERRGFPSASVVAEWREQYRRVSSDAWTWRTRTLETTAGRGGEFVLCGLPLDAPVDVHATGGGRRSRSSSIRVTDSAPKTTVDFTLRAEAVVATVAQAEADMAPTAASLRLRVLQADSIGLAGAEVSVSSGAILRVGRTDSTGQARLEGLAPGVIDVRVRRIGFAEQTLQARVALGENALTIHVRGTAVVLDDIRIVGNRRVSGRLDDIDLRIRRKEANSVMTQAEINRRNPVALSQMLRRLPGIRIADMLGNTVAISTRGLKLVDGQMEACILRVMVDGALLTSLTSIDNVVPQDVYAIELFLGPSRIPPQLKGLGNDVWCGLIAIWTRSE